MRNIIALIICLTVCGCTIIPVIVSMFHVGEVSETFRTKIFDLILFLAGCLTTWLAKSEPPVPPPQ